MKYIVLSGLILLVSASAMLAQTVEVYTATVVAQDGHRLRGILAGVSSTEVFISDYADARLDQCESVALSTVRKVVLRRTNHRRATARGAVAGGVGIGLITLQSSQKNGFRSPVVYGVTLASAVVVGALVGALVGNGIKPLFSKTIRPRPRSSPDETVRGISQELRPYSVDYQQTILDRLKQLPQP